MSLTQTLHVFEQGLFSAWLVLGIAVAIAGFAALAAIWLPPGVAPRTKLARSLGCMAAAAIVFAAVSRIGLAADVTEDRRNSFSAADQRALAALAKPLVVTIHLAPEDPRYVDLGRNVLAKLARALPDLTIRLAGARALAAGSGDDRYGEIEFAYGDRRDVSRSTSPREILPLIYGLAGVAVPTSAGADEYPGYPLAADGYAALPWFFGGLPLLIGFAWWWTRRSPRIDPELIKHTKEDDHEDQ
jgi:hypothetical protein